MHKRIIEYSTYELDKRDSFPGFRSFDIPSLRARVKRKSKRAFCIVRGSSPPPNLIFMYSIVAAPSRRRQSVNYAN